MTSPRKSVLNVDLSSYTDRFVSNAVLEITKKVNFCFGKNGTGKTTITDEIHTRFSGNYNVCVFKDFDGVVENERLNAIALGTENSEIQKQIDTTDKEIADIKKETEKPEGKTENLWIKSDKAEKVFDTQDKKVKKFYTDSAGSITTSCGLGRNYNTNNFQNDIKENPKLLSDDEIKKHGATIKAEPKALVNKIMLPTVNLSEYLKSTNEVLMAKVSQQQVIAELQDNTDKQNFAKEGLRIHERKSGEKCAFCGSEISEERWALLGSYFNDEVKKLESRVDNGITKIKSELTDLDKIKEIKNDFYDKFADQVKTLNLRIKNTKNDYKTFLNSLKTALEDKKKNLFNSSDELRLAVPQDFSAIKTEYDKTVDKNNTFSQNLEIEQNDAKNALRFHEVKKALDNFEYDAEKQKLADLEKTKKEAKKSLNNKLDELEAKKTTRNNLILQTKDESKIATEINRLLKNMGVASFSLELVKDDDENQKGQYQIKGHNGNIRKITELSKGEKNIIAFLYFIFSLQQPSKNNKPKIIVLDDPMTSNDDTMQYLMIGEIQKLYKNIGDNYFILLTHNCHFYLNARKPIDKFYEKYGNFHLFTDGKLTTIKTISNGNDDFKTNYEMLWKELVFLYEQNKPDLMLNSCRKICETYQKFNCIKDFYGNNTSAKKFFDVNQHAIDDLEAEQNGRTKDDIKNTLSELFKTNNAEAHFNNYFNVEQNT